MYGQCPSPYKQRNPKRHAFSARQATELNRVVPSAIQPTKSKEPPPLRNTRHPTPKGRPPPPTSYQNVWVASPSARHATHRTNIRVQRGHSPPSLFSQNSRGFWGFAYASAVSGVEKGFVDTVEAYAYIYIYTYIYILRELSSPAPPACAGWEGEGTGGKERGGHRWARGREGCGRGGRAPEGVEEGIARVSDLWESGYGG